MGWKAKAAIGVAAGMLVSAAYRRLRRIDLRGKSVVIAGGSRGLGLELARVFAGDGARLTLLARDADALDRAGNELAGADVIAVVCDVRDPHSVADSVRRIERERGGVDVLVNVAGIIDVAPFEHLDDHDFADSLATHLWGPLYLIREAAARMQPGGRIVNISSIGGLVSVPHLLAYSVGKFAFTGLSEGLHAELSRRGIRVTTVCPGLMRTGSHVRARFKGRHAEEFAWFSAGAGLPLLSMDAHRAARKIVGACRSGTPFLILTPQARALHLVRAAAPNAAAAVMRLAARLLPDPTGEEGNRTLEGRSSTSAAAPSLLTRRADRAIERNNELSPVERARYLDTDSADS